MQSIHIPDVGDIQVRKSKRAKRIIYSISAEGVPRVTVPHHVPYSIAKSYVKKNVQWFKEHVPTHKTSIVNGQQIGKEHHIHFRRGNSLRSRVTKTDISIEVPSPLTITNAAVQAEAHKAVTRAIRRQAETYLPKLLRALADAHGYSYREVRCKNLKTRWGSCSSEQIINLNIWLMQLPENVITYVLAHELAHLNHPHHQASFWNEVALIIPDYKECRQQLKSYRPSLMLLA